MGCLLSTEERSASRRTCCLWHNHALPERIGTSRLRDQKSSLLWLDEAGLLWYHESLLLRLYKPSKRLLLGLLLTEGVHSRLLRHDEARLLHLYRLLYLRCCEGWNLGELCLLLEGIKTCLLLREIR